MVVNETWWAPHTRSAQTQTVGLPSGAPRSPRSRLGSCSPAGPPLTPGVTSTKSQEDYTRLQPLKTIANACSTYKRYEFTPFCNVL